MKQSPLKKFKKWLKAILHRGQLRYQSLEEDYRLLFETMDQGVIYLAVDGRIISANPAAERILGLTTEQMRGKTSADSIWKAIREDGSALKLSEHPVMVALETGEPVGPITEGAFNPRLNDYVWLSINAIPLFRPGETKPYQVYANFRDITTERIANRDYQQLFNEMVDAFAVHEIICDDTGKPVDYRFLKVNPAFERMTGLNASKILGRTVMEVLPVTEQHWIETYGKVALTGEPLKFQSYAISSDQHFVVSAYQPFPNQFACTFSDISDRIRAEEKLLYMVNHDYLTGLYNRRFFEEELIRMDNQSKLPLAVMIGDINGVKLVNDAFCHEEGDRLIIDSANIISSCLREEDIIARIGGDEFGILMPNTSDEDALNVLNCIKDALNAFDASTARGKLTHSVSLGYATKVSADQDINQIIRTAEEYMYQRKLLEHNSSHSAIIYSIKATMNENSYETAEHAERLVALTRTISDRLDVNDMEKDRLEVLATLHDIGKVGISERLLRKPTKLSKDEWIEMKRHPEIGYRIAIATPELIPIAESILCHHEHWDGSGYPQGLKMEAIPLLSRILSVADAYDAMTQDRPYRKAMTHEEALIEIKSCAGTQFDPRIVQAMFDSFNVVPIDVEEHASDLNKTTEESSNS